MLNLRLKVSARDLDTLRNLVLQDCPKEAGAFALAGLGRTADNMDILIRRPIAVPRELFTVQHEYRLEVAPKAINGLIGLCEANKLGAVICHSHPADIPYSPSDDAGEARIVSTLRQVIPQAAPTASLLFWPGGVRGRVWLPGSLSPVPLSEIVVVGRSLHRMGGGNPCGPSLPISGELHDREIRAFGREGHSRMAAAKVGIVGVGGTGSSTAEQLVRLGVRDLVLVDPDVFTPPNLTRVYGTFYRTVVLARNAGPSRGLKKVGVLSRHLRRINPGIKIRSVAHSVVLTKAARALLDRDIIMLCTDEHWGRSIVNQIAYQYFVPSINVGMHISAEDGRIGAGIGCADVLRPDLPCLWCKQYLNADRIAAESMPRAERANLRKEGYVEDIDTPAPSVVNTTTMLAGMGVTLFQQLLTDFMGDNGELERLNFDLLTGTVRRGRTTPAASCICKKVRGQGDLGDLPTLDSIPN